SVYECPQCHKRLQSADDMRGQPVQCPSCGRSFVAGEAGRRGSSSGPVAPGRPLLAAGGGGSPDALSPDRRPERWSDDDDVETDRLRTGRRYQAFGGDGKARAATVALLAWCGITLVQMGIYRMGLRLVARALSGQPITS